MVSCKCKPQNGGVMNKHKKKIKMENLPDSELDIMFVLWRSAKPQKASEIVKLLIKSHAWKPSTVHTLLARLEEKHFVTVDKESYSHYFSPLISEDEYRAAESRSVLERLCGGSIKKMVASLITNESISDEDIKELTDMLQKNKVEMLQQNSNDIKNKGGL